MSSSEPIPEKFNRFLNSEGKVKITDPCELLGLPADFAEKDNYDDAELKKAYGRLVSKYHPDNNNNSAISKILFQAINDANNLLRDPRLRREYVWKATMARASRSGERLREDYQAAREARARKDNPEIMSLCKQLNSAFPTREKIHATFGEKIKDPFISDLKLNSSIASVRFDINPDSRKIRLRTDSVFGTVRYSPDIAPELIKATIGAMNVRDTGLVHPKTLSPDAAQRIAVETGRAVLRESSTQPGMIAVSHPNGKKYSLDGFIELSPDRFATKEIAIGAIESMFGVKVTSPSSEPSKREAIKGAEERAAQAEARQRALIAEKVRAAEERAEAAKKEAANVEAAKAARFPIKLAGAAKAVAPQATKHDVCAGLNAIYATNPDKLAIFRHHLDDKFQRILSRPSNGVDQISFEVLPGTDDIAIKFDHYKHGTHVFILPPTALEEAKGAMNIYSTGFVHPASLAPADAAKMAQDTQRAVLRESTTRPGMIAISLPNGEKYLLNELIAAAPDKFATQEKALASIKERFGFDVQPVVEPIALATTKSADARHAAASESDMPDPDEGTRLRM
ncbi:MAG: J domain-containing protein [Legionellaceae bacterium]